MTLDNLSKGHRAAVPGGMLVQELVAECKIEAVVHLEADSLSVREVVDMVCRVTGQEFPVEESPRREGDPAVLGTGLAATLRQPGRHCTHGLGVAPAPPERV